MPIWTSKPLLTVNIDARKTKLYEDLETDKLDVNDLTPRIKDLKLRQAAILLTLVYQTFLLPL